MRHCGVIILIFLIGCKAAPPASTPVYSEDLSVHRPAMVSQMEPTSDSVQTTMEEFVPLTGHIKAELDSIIKISLAQNKEQKLVDGFFIQIYNGNSRERANRIRNRVDSFFPDLAPKISYHQPNFRVKAGKFTNRLKAYRVFQEVKSEFSRALLVPDRFIMKYE